MIIRLITTDYLIKHTNIDKTVDVEVLKTSINSAQLANILPVLGNKLFNKLILMVNEDNVSGMYVDVIEKLSPALALWSHYNALPFINYKSAAKGIMISNDTNANAAGLDELKYLRSVIRDNAELLNKQLEDWLNENAGLIPEYQITTNPNTLFSGIHFQKNNKTGRYE